MENYNEDIIYHYCSVESFYNIINSKVLWLSDSAYMNDRFEGKWIDEVFKHIDITANQIIPIDIKERYKEIVGKKQYIFCFSENGDKLSQWRGYADDAKGVAIGFSKKELGLPSIVTEVDGIDVLTTQSGIAQMIYSEAKQTSLLHEIIASIATNKQIDNRLIFIKELSIKYKNPSFQEEEEVRMVHVPENNREINKFSAIKYRISNGDIVGYYEFNLTDQDVYASALIPKIILGPKCTLKESDLNQFLQNCGILEAEITKSISSYR